MGGILSISSLACCFTSAACSAGCSLCSLCENSTLSKLMYALILLVTLILSCLMLTPGVQSWLQSMPFCEESKTHKLMTSFNQLIPGQLQTDVGVSIKCADAIGYLAVYRLCFVVTTFFLVMSLIMIGVTRTRDPRSGLQNGFW